MHDAILVLGGGGFVGKALVTALAARGESVIVASRRRIEVSLPGVEAATGEFQEPAEFASLLKRSRSVVHLATTSTPGTSAARPLREVQTNLHLTASLLQALQEVPGRGLLYFSSGGSLYSDSHTPLAESGEVHPRSYHGAGKLAAEAFISAWCAQFGEGAVALRPSNVYGPGQPERPGFGIIPAAFGKILRGETLSIWGDGQAQRDYVFIDDLVKLCLEILSRPFEKGLQPVNCASGQSVSLNALLDMMEGVSGKPLLRRYDRSRALDASCIAMDPTLANRLYGWSAGVDLESGLARTWERFVNDAR